MQNNIFNYATSELSNDAIICWLVNSFNYSSASNELKGVSERLIKKLLFNKTVTFDEVKVKKQFYINANYNDLKVRTESQEEPSSAENKKRRLYIDIYIELKYQKEIVHKIIIEDKIESRENGNQLTDYRSYFVNRNEDCTFVFMVIGNRSKTYIRDINEKRWNTIKRDALFDCINCDISKLEKSEGILIHYINYLSNQEDEINNYREIEIKNWKPNQVQGFYNSLDELEMNNDWGFVNNPKGGFWAIWFSQYKFEYDKETVFVVYLQFQIPFIKSEDILNLSVSDIQFVVKLTTDNYDYLKINNNQILDKSIGDFKSKLLEKMKLDKFDKLYSRNARTMSLISRSPFEETTDVNIDDLEGILRQIINEFDEVIVKISIDNKKFKKII